MLVRVDQERGEIHFKLTYFGPGMSGKQSCLRYIWNRTRSEYKTAWQDVFPSDELGVFSRDECIRLGPTLRGRQVWFELTPATLAPINGLRVKLDLQANSGGLWSESSRRLSLECADGVMFVAHSNTEGAEANLEALQMLDRLLAEGVAHQAKIPRVFSYNKRDISGVRDLAELERDLNPQQRWPSFATSGIHGEGVFAALKALVSASIRPLGEWPHPRAAG